MKADEQEEKKEEEKTAEPEKKKLDMFDMFNDSPINMDSSINTNIIK